MKWFGMHQRLVRLPAIALLTESSPTDVKFHGRTFLAIAAVCQNLFDNELLSILLGHSDRVGTLFVIVKGTKIVNMSHHYFILNQILYRIDWTGNMQNLIRTAVTRN